MKRINLSFRLICMQTDTADGTKHSLFNLDSPKLRRKCYSRIKFCTTILQDCSSKLLAKLTRFTRCSN